MHVSVGALPPSTAGAGMFGPLDAAPPEPVEPAPVDVVAPIAAPPELEVSPPPPAHAPPGSGMHVNPSPQSASTLHANCHLYAHVEIDFGVHVVDGTGSQFVPAAHPADVPPHSSVDV